MNQNKLTLILENESENDRKWQIFVLPQLLSGKQDFDNSKKTRHFQMYFAGSLFLPLIQN